MRRRRPSRWRVKRVKRCVATIAAAAETSNAPSRIQPAKCRRGTTAASSFFAPAELDAVAERFEWLEVIGLQQLRIQLFAVIVHNHQVLVRRRLDDGWSQGVLREMKLGQRAWIVGLSIGEVAKHRVRLNRLAKVVEAVFEGRDAEGFGAARGGAQNVQQKPKTGNKRDGREREDCEFIARQADQFNITGRYTLAMLIAPS